MCLDFSGQQSEVLRQLAYRREARLLEQMEVNFTGQNDRLWTLT
jgi:hypothetical protein